MESIENYMRRAFELAQLGLGKVSPNPLVGCVIVKDGRIIGEGYHQGYGGPHAEVNAVNSVTDKKLLVGSQVMVSLEPCSHQGKTPPCADLLVKHQVREVFVSSKDPNPLVNGKGIDKLTKAGIQVQTGILEGESKELNRRFFTSFEKDRPYIILKWAETADGFIAKENFDSKWISDQYSRKLVHKWRFEEDAILVGASTVRYDNPQLNVRDWQPADSSAGNFNPVRIVIDKDLKLNGSFNLFQDGQKTLCFNTVKDEVIDKTTFIKIASENFLNNLLRQLHDQRLQSVIVEGGAFTINQFIKENLWDEARIFKSPRLFKSGISAPKISGKTISENKVVDDTLTIIKNN